MISTPFISAVSFVTVRQNPFGGTGDIPEFLTKSEVF
jgi:hypothetical protein